jgi:hypothetical protein
MKDLNKLTTKEVLNDLFNIVSNGDYDMNELRHHFDRVDKDLTKQEKKDKLLELNNELINAYQAHLVSLHTIDRPMIEKWKNEIFRLQDKIKTLEEELK